MAQLLIRVMELGVGESAEPPDIVIRPDLGGMGLANFTDIDRFELAGYDAVLAALG